MSNPDAIHAFLARRYPEPPPDRKWVEDCVAALRDDGQSVTAKAVEEQYLWSNLGASTHASGAGKGLPTPEETGRHSGVLFPSPVVVQVHTLSEIGVSAFAQKTTLEQRADILSGATRIRRMDDEDDDDNAADAKGAPPYPRHMLCMDVSDGRTLMRAIEYRRLEKIILSETPLGIKLRLQNVKCLKGTLLLTPDNCSVLGGGVAELDAQQPQAFIDGLEARLNTARNAPAGGQPPARATRRRTLPNLGAPDPAPARAPARATTTARAAPARRPTTQTSDAARAARRAALEALSHASVPANPPSDATFDDSFDFDDSALREAEAAAVATQSARSARSQTNNTTDHEVIVISDSE